MRKKEPEFLRYFLILLFFSFCGVTFAMGNSQDNSQSGNYSTDQARQDYRLYLAKLKELSQQYGQITGEMKKVIKEEGIPVWDDQSGGIKMTHDLNLASSGPIRETEKEIKVILEAPGLKKNSIRINIEDQNFLRIQAVKKPLEGQETEESFEKIYELPSPVRDNNASARYEDGILTVTLQKLQTPKKIVPVTVQ